MAAEWKEVSFSYVDLRKLKGSSASSVSANFSHNDWYNRLMMVGQKHVEQVKTYDLMDTTTDINRALDIIAEDISSENADDYRSIEILYSDGASDTYIETINASLDKWKNITNLDYNFFNIVRETIKYGCTIFKIKKDGNLQKIAHERFKGYKLDAEDDSVVTHYIFNPSETVMNAEGERVVGADQKTTTEETIEVKDLLVLKIGDGPYGESILKKVYRIWRQLQLLEDSVIIYRIVRAPERRVFYIDVGRLAPHKQEAYIERVKQKIKQKQVIKNDQINSEYAPNTMQEDYYIANQGDGRGSKVETLPGGSNVGEIGDIKYFQTKLANALRIPPSYLNGSSEDNQSLFNDGRTGVAYIAELRYVGFIKRLQTQIAKYLQENFFAFLKSTGIEFSDDIKLRIADPQSFAIYKQNELNNQLLNTFNTSDNIRTISKELALKKFLLWTEEEIAENEEAILKELGFTEEEIKKLSESERKNIVYGDGRLNPYKEEDETETN